MKKMLMMLGLVMSAGCAWAEGLYCVIDLSGGTSATSYPVSYLPGIPSGGWSDEYKTTKLVLRKVDAGTFTMGSPTDELGRCDTEAQHQVTLTKDYYIGVFPVTQRQWELVMGDRPSCFTNSIYYASRPVEQVTYDMIRGSPKGAGWPHFPDVDATSFLGVLRKKSGLQLDLPTEAQWEYACRAGTTTALNSGKNLTNPLDKDAEMDKVGRYWHNGGSSWSQECDWSHGTAKVGSYAPNDWGLYDMHGNVLEWCLDWYGSYSGDATDPKGPPSGLERVCRGGSWSYGADTCRSADRHDDNDPTKLHGSFFGFRLCCPSTDDPLPQGGPYKETVGGIEWTFMVDADLKASLGRDAVSQSTSGDIVIPSILGGRNVTGIGESAFNHCEKLTSVGIPDTVTTIGFGAFLGCKSLTSMKIPKSVTSIATGSLQGCTSLKKIEVASDNPCYLSRDSVLFNKSMTELIAYPAGKEGSYEIPAGVTTVCYAAFSGCLGLTNVRVPSSVTTIETAAFTACGLQEVVFEGDAPVTGDYVFSGTPADMIIKIKEGTSGWIQWNGKKLVYEGGGGGTTAVTLTVTNVVVHYIQTSELSPMAAPITPDVGIVNVMTEIEGGIVAVPESWATNYPSFKQKFGDDFAVALTRETGKFDANRKPMYVWQDYVAGTDPTNVKDQFRASVTMVGGKPVISFTPVLSEKEAAKRVYTTYGKVKLQDETWTPIPEGQEADYNFFKVTVKMK